MSVDILLTENLETTWSEVGDISTVRDTDDDATQIKQSIIISVLERERITSPSLSPSDVEQQRGWVRNAVRDNPTTEEPITVTVENIDYDEQSITYQVTTNRVSVPITQS